MLFHYTTERLELNVLAEDAATLVTDFLVNNRDFFAPFEPAHSEEYYTVSYQTRVLAAESAGALKSSFIRYYLFLRDSGSLIGTVCFQHIKKAPAASCEIGYRLDRSFCRQGYMTEALSFLLPKICLYYGLNRIEANILSANTASCALAERCGFVYEGTMRNYYEIGGTFRDHKRYSWLISDYQTP